MTRLTLSTLSIALLTSIVSVGSLACDSSSVDAPTATQATAQAQRAAESAPEPSASTPAPKVEAPLAVTPPIAPIPVIEDQPVLASTTIPSVAPSATPSAPQQPTSTPALERREREPDSLRSPSLLPAGTPELNIAAFTNLDIGKRDKAPLAGVGATGIHLDGLEVGKGWASGSCEDVGSQFVVDVDERINVCMHVIHPREAEAVTLEWARDGKVRQIIQVSVKPTHSYSTRAWMPVTAGRVGDWTATVKSEDGSVLGQVAFEVAG